MSSFIKTIIKLGFLQTALKAWLSFAADTFIRTNDIIRLFQYSVFETRTGLHYRVDIDLECKSELIPDIDSGSQIENLLNR